MMRILKGRIAWGWKMFGILGKDNTWFFGFSMRDSAEKIPTDLLVGDVVRGRK